MRMEDIQRETGERADTYVIKSIFEGIALSSRRSDSVAGTHPCVLAVYSFQYPCRGNADQILPNTVERDGTVPKNLRARTS